MRPRFHVSGLMKSENNSNWLGCRKFTVNVRVQSLIIWREGSFVVCYECTWIYWGVFLFLSSKYKFTPACYASYCFDHLSIYESSYTFFFITALQQVTPPILCVMRDFRRPPRSRWELRSSYRRIQQIFEFLIPEDGTGRLSRNFGKKLPLLSA